MKAPEPMPRTRANTISRHSWSAMARKARSRHMIRVPSQNTFTRPSESATRPTNTRLTVDATPNAVTVRAARSEAMPFSMPHSTQWEKGTKYAKEQKNEPMKRTTNLESQNSDQSKCSAGNSLIKDFCRSGAADDRFAVTTDCTSFPLPSSGCDLSCAGGAGASSAAAGGAADGGSDGCSGVCGRSSLPVAEVSSTSPSPADVAFSMTK
mmetsp:Transcript_36553/g.104676  ORF Transcript_36553/g.104676 Transcript_36553/m.104676 type:complete len:209 (+) Transcript_36553:2435-3061(+)